MKSIRQLSLIIWKGVKNYCRRISELQDEVIKFNDEVEKILQGDKK